MSLLPRLLLLAIPALLLAACAPARLGGLPTPHPTTRPPVAPATPPPPGPLALVMDREAYDPLQRAFVWGSGFAPGAAVTLSAVGDLFRTELQLPQAKADRRGSFQVPYVMPNQVWGEIFVVTASASDGQTLTTRFVLAQEYRYAWRPCDHGG